MAVPRKDIVDLNVTKLYHCTSRCVRRAFLCGDGYEHRKQWIEDRIELLAANFGVSVCSFSIMDNHIHVLVRLEPDTAAGWTDEEVVRRWTNVYHPATLDIDDEQTLQACIDHRLQNTEKVADYRKWLKDLGSFMKALKEQIARRANKEEKITGIFWDGRYGSVGILDAEALLATCAYIDLNPVAAELAVNPESSEHTSFQQRVKHAMANGAYERLQEAAEGSMAARRALAEMEHEHWLCPFENREEVIDTVDLGADEEQPRKGMLPGYSLASYLELVDYTSRLFREGKSSVPQETPALLDRLKMTPEAWVECMNKMQAKKRKFGNAFAMNPERLREVATYRRVHHTVNSVT